MTGSCGIPDKVIAMVLPHWSIDECRFFIILCYVWNTSAYLWWQFFYKQTC